MRVRQQRPRQGQRETGTETEAAGQRKTAKGRGESPIHSKTPEAGGHPAAGAPPGAGCWGDARAEERQFCAGTWAPGVKVCCKEDAHFPDEGQGSLL